MPIWKINVNRRKHPSVLSSVVFTPPSLDLDPGESGSVVVSGLDTLGRPVAVVVQAVVAPPGLTVSRAENRLTIVADAIGPAVDELLTVDVDVI